MPNVSLINIRISNTVFMPLGLLHIASELEQHGFTVQVQDVFTYEPDESVLQRVVDFRPGYVGFSIVTPTVSKTRGFLERLRKRLPEAVYFAGGVHPTVAPEKTMEDLGLSFVVVGEGEMTLREALQNLEAGQSLEGVAGLMRRDESRRLVLEPPRPLVADLDSFPLPARHLVDVNKYFIAPGYIRSYFLDRVANVLTSRGCPMPCVFCCSHLLSGRKVRRRRLECVMAEIDSLIDHYDLDGIYISDETFTFRSEWVLGFCEEIEKRGLPWGCATHVGLVDDRLVKRMREAGCIQVDTGVESGSNRVLKTIKKQITDTEIRETFALYRRHGIRTFATFMVGNPEETKEDILLTRDLIREIRPTYTLFSWFTPFYGTSTFEWMRENRQDLKIENVLESYDFITSDSPPVNLTNMTDQELVESRSLLQRTVFLQNYLSACTLHNIRYILAALFWSCFDPQGMAKALWTACRRRSAEYFVYFVFYSYQRHLVARHDRRGAARPPRPALSRS